MFSSCITPLCFYLTYWIFFVQAVAVVVSVDVAVTVAVAAVVAVAAAVAVVPARRRSGCP